MSSEWIKLTERGGAEIYVNLATASSIQRLTNGPFTKIWFLAGEREGVVDVMENPSEIFTELKKVQDANRT